LSLDGSMMGSYTLQIFSGYRGTYYFKCPGFYHNPPTCDMWNGNDFVEVTNCNLVAYDNATTTCNCTDIAKPIFTKRRLQSSDGLQVPNIPLSTRTYIVTLTISAIRRFSRPVVSLEIKMIRRVSRASFTEDTITSNSITPLFTPRAPCFLLYSLAQYFYSQSI
jgi:hypothetical protein